MSTIHNPSNFEPANYVVVDYVDNRRPEYYGQDVESYAAEVEFWKADMARLFGENYSSKIHKCIHCGNGNVRWITAVEHVPTGEVVVFGSDCTERLGFENRVAFKLAQIQARAEALKVRIAVYRKVVAFREANPALDALVKQVESGELKPNSFVSDVLAKLGRYGSLSDRQVAAVLSSVKRDAEFAARKAVEATEVKGDAPTGRVEVSGVVLSTKDVESAYGVTTKMLVKLANNSKVWVTVPSAESINRGDEITFKATFEVSRDDKSFAFGKRPVVTGRKDAGQVTA